LNYNKNYTNRLFNQALSVNGLGVSSESTPDTLCLSYSKGNIPDEFIVCRNKQNVPTAIYKNDKWDLSPYILSSKSSEVINFEDLICTSDATKDRELINEVKSIVIYLMYFINTGVAGGLAISTLTRYANVAKSAARFCIDTQEDKMIGRLSLKKLFTNKNYLAFYAKTLNSRQRQRLHALLKKLNIIGTEHLGYKVVNYQHLHKRIPHNQHPLIPTRIYLEVVNFLTDRVGFLKKNSLKLECFIKEFSDPYFGLCILSQKDRMVGDLIKPKDRSFRPTLDEAINAHNLNSLFEHPDFNCKSRKELAARLGVIQYEMKHLIHLYTGMRNDEVNRLGYDCVVDKPTDNYIFDDNDSIPSSKAIVKVISTTTKFSGYKEEESWLAHTIVLEAIEVLRAIVRGIAYIAELDPKKCSLLLSTKIIYTRDKSATGTKIFSAPKNERKYFVKRDSFIIGSDDYDVLVASDPERDFSKSPEFNIGSHWPITTHQFRRSLAFYAVNSGFVSLATLRKQFKHLSQEMTKYYSRNNENVMTIFGHYDVKAKEYVLPLNHIAYELQTGMSLDTAERLLKDLLSETSSLHGKVGGYFEKQKSQLKKGEVLVEEFIETTSKKVYEGEVNYRRTLLGGCTNAEICSCSILGEFADCLTSKCAAIKSENIDALIKSTEKELQSYHKDSVEFLSTKSELDDLLRYKTFKIKNRAIDIEDGIIDIKDKT